MCISFKAQTFQDNVLTLYKVVIKWQGLGPEMPWAVVTVKNIHTPMNYGTNFSRQCINFRAVMYSIVERVSQIAV